MAMTPEITNTRLLRDDVIHDFWGLAKETINRYADKEYIVTKDGRLTYKEVNRHANNIYTTLTALSVPRQTGVGLFMKDPLKVIPAMHGTLKARHYFTPIDPNFPEAVMKSVIDSAEIKVIITSDEYSAQAKTIFSENIILINYDKIDLTPDIPNPEMIYNPNDWAQILFTSGSTGEPKGAVEDYRYLANAAYLKYSTHHYEPSDRIMQIPNFTFSGPHTIVFGALLLGVTLCFYNIKDDGFAGLADWIKQEQITCYNSTATIFRSWISTLHPDETFPTVRFARTGSEKMLHSDLEACKKHFPNLRYFRLGFASTETQAVASKMFPLDYDFGTNEIPCGLANEGIKIFIWDENRNELPVGAEGEIVVYGDALARGYIKNPILTKEKFIPDPRNPIFQYYKTGDLGKLKEDGMLIHLGRIDNMVKIKGVRIELDSIEKHMNSYPGILQSVFNVFENHKGNKKLTAYFITEEGIQIPISDLRKFLSDRLPSHLLPHFFIQLDKFPMTRTGKLDKNQLPRPAMKRPPLSNPYVAPANKLESTLVRIWEEEIGVEGIGVTDDFFEVGGDSLVGVVLFIRIEKELKQNLPVSSLLSASTIRNQAEMINGQIPLDNFAPLLTISPGGRNTPLFFIPGKGGYPTRIRHLAKLIDSETPVYAMQDLLERHDYKPLRQVEAIATFYINEMKKIVPHGPYVLVGESMGGKIALEMTQQLAKQDDVPILALLDTYNSGTTQVNEKGFRYYWMLLEKHLTILFRSNWQGRLDYIKFYRETIRDKIKHKLPGIRKNANTMERNNMIAAQKYRPRPYPGRLLLFKALRGPNAGEPANGWDKVELGELVIHPLDCYHGSILFEPAVSELAKVLNEYITQQNNQVDRS
jgi:amino acid adenylation domain-containing protein